MYVALPLLALVNRPCDFLGACIISERLYRSHWHLWSRSHHAITCWIIVSSLKMRREKQFTCTRDDKVVGWLEQKKTKKHAAINAPKIHCRFHCTFLQSNLSVKVNWCLAFSHFLWTIKIPTIKYTWRPNGKTIIPVKRQNLCLS